MYDVALSVAACARAGTRGCRLDDLARGQQGSRDDHARGGHLGVLANGAFTGLLADAAARQLPTGRRVRHRVEEWEASTSGLPADSTVEFLVVPAAQFPEEVWPALMAREPVIIDSVLDGDDVTQIAVTTSASATGAEATALPERPGRRSTSPIPLCARCSYPAQRWWSPAAVRSRTHSSPR